MQAPGCLHIQAPGVFKQTDLKIQKQKNMLSASCTLHAARLLCSAQKTARSLSDLSMPAVCRQEELFCQHETVAYMIHRSKQILSCSVISTSHHTSITSYLHFLAWESCILQIRALGRPCRSQHLNMRA